jgi:hypothetical protein
VKRILVTGSREWIDDTAIRRAFISVRHPIYPAILVHGAAPGADNLADQVGRYMGWSVERYPAKDFSSPRARNQHMVNLGADVCLAFADKWASGTGMCARMARKAGIPVIDYGVDTSLEGKP